jgi:hypothetical protein
VTHHEPSRSGVIVGDHPRKASHVRPITTVVHRSGEIASAGARGGRGSEQGRRVTTDGGESGDTTNLALDGSRRLPTVKGRHGLIGTVLGTTPNWSLVGPRSRRGRLAGWLTPM